MRLPEASRKVVPGDATKAMEWLAKPSTGGEDPEASRRAGDVLAAALWNAPPVPVDPPLDLRTAAALVKLSERLRADGQLALAAVCLAEASTRDPNPARTDALLAMLEEARLWADLAPFLRDRIGQEVSPERRREAYRRLGRCLEEGQGKYSEAADLFEKAAAEFPDTARFLQDQARCLEAARRFDAFLAVVERQLQAEADPARKALLHSRAATALETLGRSDEALAHYREATRLAPKLEPPIQALLAAAEARQDWKLLVELLKDRLKLEARPRERATILTRLSETLARRLGDLDGACAFLERAVREYPRGLPARLLLLELLCETRQFERADRYATPPDVAEGHGLAPEQLARLCLFRSRVAAARGRDDEAVDALCLALKVAPRPEVYVAELLLFIRAEQPEVPSPDVLQRLARDWERAGNAALAAKGLLAAALLDRSWGRVHRAETILRWALRLAPRDAAIHRALAELFLSGRRARDAAECLLHAAKQIPEEALGLTVEAARILADHADAPDEALHLLEEVHTDHRGSVESRLLAAAVALAVGDLDGCQAELAALDRSAPEATERAAVLELRLLDARGVVGEPRERALAAAAHAGSPRILREVAGEAYRSGGLQKVDALAAQVSPHRHGALLRMVGHGLRQRGLGEEAKQAYLESLQYDDGEGLEALEALALLSPELAAPRLAQALAKDPFQPRAAALYSSVLSAAGNPAKAEAISQLAVALRGQLLPPAALNLDPFLAAVAAPDPLYAALRAIRAGLGATVDAEEEHLFDASRPAPLPDEARELVETVCRRAGMPAPAIHHGAVDAAPLVLDGAGAVVVSYGLFDPEQPPSALALELLRALGVWLAGAGPLSYLSTYRLEVLGEAMRLGAKKPARGGQLLADTFDLSVEQGTALMEQGLSLAKDRRPDFIDARQQLGDRLLRAALASTRDVTAALAAVAQRAPPRIAPAATGERWLRALRRNPQARVVVGYALSDRYAQLFGREAGERSSAADSEGAG